MNNYELTYSNLIDTKTQEYVKDSLIKNGILPEIANSFITIVKSYNSAVDIIELSTSKPGFTTIREPQVPYDEIYLENHWNRNEFLYNDLNCRITAFGLFGNYISSPERSEEDIFGFGVRHDMIVIDENPLSKLYNINIGQYANYYDWFKLSGNINEQDFLVHIVNMYKERNISYKFNNNISIINVFMFDSYFEEVFIGHAGILIDLKEEVLFIEKISPCMPYQVLKFKNNSKVKDFLLNRFSYSSDTKVIMNNDKAL